MWLSAEIGRQSMRFLLDGKKMVGQRGAPRQAPRPRVSALRGRLTPPRPYGISAPPLITATCCRSSVVEHSLGKGEVHSSILSGSTTIPLKITIARRLTCVRDTA